MTTTTTTLQIGSILYLRSSEMNHDARPMIVMGIVGDEAMLMPLSSSSPMRGPYKSRWLEADASRGCNAYGWMAPNRVIRGALAHTLPTPAGEVTLDEVHLAWDAWEEYITPVKR